MKKTYILLSIAILLLSGCNEKKEEQKKSDTPVAQTQENKADAQNIYGASTQKETQIPKGADVQTNEQHTAVVLETMNAAGYTYVKVNDNGTVYWVAGPETKVHVGGSVSYIEQMMMKNFTSKSLNRNFENLMFASALIPVGLATHTDAAPITKTTSSPHSATQADAKNTQEKISVKKLAAGYSVEELYAQKSTLKDKKVKIRAQVVKVSKNIMGKDWIHIQDGSGGNGTSDIIATGKNTDVQVGDVVIVNATLKVDVDLGYGYFFAVILQESTFTK